MLPHSIRTQLAKVHRAAAATAAAASSAQPPVCTAITWSGLTASAPSSNVMGLDSNHHHHYYCAVRCFATKKFQKNKGASSSSSSSKSDNNSASSSSPYGFSDADFAAARSKDLDLLLAALNAPSRREPPISIEEKARRHEIGRNYVIGRFQQHNEIHHDLAWYVLCVVSLSRQSCLFFWF